MNKHLIVNDNSQLNHFEYKDNLQREVKDFINIQLAILKASNMYFHIIDVFIWIKVYNLQKLLNIWEISVKRINKD